MRRQVGREERLTTAGQRQTMGCAFGSSKIKFWAFKMSGCRGRRAGFTLIELLVAIAIIAVLLGLV
ncbi:MAG: type II secretion system protein, partial [Planctomycetia bacterium]